MTRAGFDADRLIAAVGQPRELQIFVRRGAAPCAECDTASVYQRTDLPGTVDVTLGSMDDPKTLELQDHTWTENWIDWIRLNDGVPEYPREGKLLPSS